MDRTNLEIGIVLVLGVLLGVGSYLTLSSQAAILFLILYIMVIPFIHEVVHFRGI